MLKSLFGQRSKPAVSAVPDGVVAYAIGDVHGRADLLGVILDAILADMKTTQADVIVVGLGDYIDRGPHSRVVVDLLLDWRARPHAEVHLLRGNHEKALLDFLGDAAFGPTWRTYGGGETLESYGVQPPEDDDEAGWVAARDAFEKALPPEHLAFFQTLEPSFTLGSYFFAHAGARPGVPLDKQEEQDLYWIRDRFLNDRRRFDKLVVHGHSVSRGIHSDQRRIGIDTGAYATGRLTTVRLEGSERMFISTDTGPKGFFLHAQRQA